MDFGFMVWELRVIATLFRSLVLDICRVVQKNVNAVRRQKREI